MNKIKLIIEDLDGKTSSTIVPISSTEDLKKLRKQFIGMDVTHNAVIVGKIIGAKVES